MMKKQLSFLSMFLYVLITYAQICPDDHHPHMIDLGLPSGTKWACCNVGADKPEGYGGYYAWGETEEKDFYDWSTYTHCDGSNSTCHNIGNDIAGTQYDVAHMKWGGSWRIPSRDQQVELLTKCITMWITKNGGNGMTFIGPNGGTIFLPAAGCRWFDDRNNFGSDGDYWSSSLDMEEGSYSNACGLNFNSAGKSWFNGNRSIGRTIRPIINVNDNINPTPPISDTFNQAIYNLYGIKVADTTADVNTLPPGIYIVNGKKTVIK